MLGSIGMGHGGSRWPIPGRPPGEYEASPEDEQEFVAGALYCQGSMSLGPNTPIGRLAIGTVVAVPVGQQPAVDRVLAAQEREAVELDITSSWTVMGMPSRTAGLDVVIARLDLVLAGPTVPTPVQARIFFGDVREADDVLWAAALAKRVLLFREPTFHRVALRMQDATASGSQFEVLLGSGGLEIENLGGCDVLRVGLEKAGVKDDIFEGRHI